MAEPSLGLGWEDQLPGHTPSPAGLSGAQVGVALSAGLCPELALGKCCILECSSLSSRSPQAGEGGALPM